MDAPCTYVYLTALRVIATVSTCNFRVKVGSRVTSACLMMDAGKRCHTIVQATEASRSPAAGLRAFLPKYHALVAITGSREGSKEVLEEIAPLTAMAELVKTIIR